MSKYILQQLIPAGWKVQEGSIFKKKYKVLIWLPNDTTFYQRLNDLEVIKYW